MRPMRFFAAAILFLATLGLTSPLSAQRGIHKDERIGFSIKPPSGWDRVPITATEAWIVAQFLSDNEDTYYDKDMGWTQTHRPRLHAVALLDALRNQPDIEEDEETGETKARLLKGFQNYEEFLSEYLRANYRTGFFKIDEGEGQLKGVPYRWVEVKSESVASIKLSVLAWIFKTDLGEVAIQMDCVQPEFKKHKKKFLKVMKSFRTIKRTKTLETAATEFSSLYWIHGMTAEKRELLRKEHERQEWKKVSEVVPDGWDAVMIDGVYVLNHSDKRFAKKVVERIKATYRWLEDTLGAVGPGEYVRAPIVRICEDSDEMRVFLSGPGVRGGSTIVTYRDTSSGATSYTFESISQQAMDLWFRDRDVDLYFLLPFWFSSGIDQVVGTARVKGKSLEFNSDWWEQWLKTSMRQGESENPRTAREILSTVSTEISSDYWRFRYESMRLVRMLVDTRSKKHRAVLGDYLANLKLVNEELEEEAEKEGNKLKKPTNEAEEDAYFEARKSRAAERERILIAETMSRTFASWDSGDWRKLEKEFTKAK